MNKNSKIFVAGHRGLVGSALVRRLEEEGCSNLVLRGHAQLDLEKQADVEAFFEKERPEYVFMAAAKVGGIHANNTYPAEFIHNNIAIQTNIIHSAWREKTKRLLFLGSSCIYPRECPQPMKEEHLLTGPLEATNESYAIAKIAGIKMCEAYNRQYGTSYLAAMPTNLYGPNDNFDLENSHVLPALIRKFHLALLSAEGKEDEIKRNERIYGKIPGDHPLCPASVTVWGTGKPFREFLHVDDLADACVFLMNLEERAFAQLVAADRVPLVNIGLGKEITIKDLAELVKTIVGFEGKIIFDPSKPDGTPRKLLDVSRMKTLGWQSATSLSKGIRSTYKFYLKNAVDRCL
ncbi:MAG: GDP-L-fucose synthase [Desulfobacteraceae bacterium]|nr:MAG: GDP-L-fucose synthase [Desulfobacteraceae bacterium]